MRADGATHSAGTVGMATVIWPFCVGMLLPRARSSLNNWELESSKVKLVGSPAAILHVKVAGELDVVLTGVLKVRPETRELRARRPKLKRHKY